MKFCSGSIQHSIDLFMSQPAAWKALLQSQCVSTRGLPALSPIEKSQESLMISLWARVSWEMMSWTHLDPLAQA